MKLHRRVCLIQTEDAVLAEELLARKKLAQDIVGRLTDRVLLVRPGRVEGVIQELQRMGHTPQVAAKETRRARVDGRRFAPRIIMAPPDPAFWADLLRQTLASYDEALLRQTAAHLIKPRNQWPVEELIERCVAGAENPAVLDRRLADLEAAPRRLLALIGHSRQPFWDLGNLIEMLVALGSSDGLQPVFALLQAGLVFPRLPEGATARIKTFEQWLAFPGATGLAVFTPPLIASRAVGEDLGVPDLSADAKEVGNNGETAIAPSAAVHEADGLEWILRTGVLWQQTAAAPLRRTQQGDFFKRDLERLGQDPILNGPPADRLTDVPDMGFLTAVLAERAGVLRETDGEVRVGSLPAEWDTGLAPSLEALWSQLWRLRAWNPIDGWRGAETPAGNPFASAYLLAFLLLARLPADAWVDPDVVEAWLNAHHPYWKDEFLRPSRRQAWVATFLLGVAYHLRLVQATQAGDEWRVRLSPAGRWLLGLGEAPAPSPGLRQTLLVQPNLEIIAYRQGLSTALIAKMTRFAAWKSLGAACMLQLEPETVYRALEAGETFESIRLTLEQHGTRAVPPAVLDSLRTWSNKRERITIYPSATLLEFATPEDLDGGGTARRAGRAHVRPPRGRRQRRGDRLPPLPADRHARLRPAAGEVRGRRGRRRDSDGGPGPLGPAAGDGAAAGEFAELHRRGSPSANGLRQYRPDAGLARRGGARASGMTLGTLEVWFQQRTGEPMPPARAHADGGRRRRLAAVPAAFGAAHVADEEELADGLMQWPVTRALIAARLGPTARWRWRRSRRRRCGGS